MNADLEVMIVYELLVDTEKLLLKRKLFNGEFRGQEQQCSHGIKEFPRYTSKLNI